MEQNKRPETMERITTAALAEAFISQQVEEIRAQVGQKKVLLALSGGVDLSLIHISDPELSALYPGAAAHHRRGILPVERLAGRAVPLLSLIHI